MRSLFAVLIGAAAGAVAGILLAPESGRATRQKLSRKASDIREELNESWNNTAEKFRELTDTVMSEVDKYKNKNKTTDIME
jgi:gas vesicle protein